MLRDIALWLAGCGVGALLGGLWGLKVGVSKSVEFTADVIASMAVRRGEDPVKAVAAYTEEVCRMTEEGS